MCKNKLIRVITIVLMAVPLISCSTTSQILPVTPQIDVPADPARGVSKTMKLTVVDARASNIVGYRDQNDATTAITSAPEMLDNIRQKLLTAYTDLGFTVVESNEDADIDLNVQLTELSYQRQTEGVVKDLRTSATLVASSVQSDRTVTGTYQAGQGKDTLVKPSLAVNAEILNAHIDAALSKLVADKRLTSTDW